MDTKSVLMPRGCGCDRSLRAFRNSRFGGIGISEGRQQEINRPPRRIDRSIHIASATLHLKVGLVNAPRLVGGLEMPSYPQLQFGAISLHPTPHRRVIGCEAALQ